MTTAAYVIALSAILIVCESLLWPFKPCRWCDGSPRIGSPLSGAWRACRHCDGSGKRLRTIPRLLRRGTKR